MLYPVQCLFASNCVAPGEAVSPGGYSDIVILSVQCTHGQRETTPIWTVSGSVTVRLQFGLLEQTKCTVTLTI